MSLSIASLLVFNGLIHLAGSLRARRYAPGLISGLLLYLPLGIMAYVFFLRSSQMSPMQVLLSTSLGMAYKAMPVIYLGLAPLFKHAQAIEMVLGYPDWVEFLPRGHGDTEFFRFFACALRDLDVSLL